MALTKEERAKIIQHNDEQLRAGIKVLMQAQVCVGLDIWIKLFSFLSKKDTSWNSGMIMKLKKNKLGICHP